MADIRLLTQEQGYGVGGISLPPNNEILTDDKGKPSVMVKIPAFKMSDVGLPGDGWHPAFIVNGQPVPYIYISKYLNVVEDGRAYSLPYREPKNKIRYDEAIAACEAKGPGWHLMSNAEWAAIALWCKKHDCMPYGNNVSGTDYYHTHDRGVYISNSNSYTLTGSGPKDWFHNGDFSGIADLNGNYHEWISGLRIVNQEIQIIANNDVAMQVDQSNVSNQWKAILADGTLVEPGTEGTLKLDRNENNDGVLVTTEQMENGSNTSYDGMFKNTVAAAGVSMPDLLKALALFPVDTPDTYRNDKFYVAYYEDERLPCRGGYCGSGGSAGVFSLALSATRTPATVARSFRSAFVNL